MRKRGGIMSLKWNVFYHDVNRQRIAVFNIFDHWKFAEDTQKNLKKIKDKDKFAEELRRDLFYYFGSKCEWEVVITSWVPHITTSELDRLNAEREKALKEYNREPYSLYVNPNVAEKIDVYNQVMNNWDIFLDYVWNSKKRRKKSVGMPNNQAINLLLHIGNNIDKIADNDEDAEVYLQAIEKAVSVLKG